MNQNFQKELDNLIAKNRKSDTTPTLFLHSCCAPCSSYVLEYLSQYFAITVYYYNPNIYPEHEYADRTQEQKRLIDEINPECVNKIRMLEGVYDKDRFYETIRGLEKEPEGGERCFACIRMRLIEAARLAKEKGFDYFCTTLSISPLKNAQMINEIGKQLEEQYAVKFLPSDFKKRNGYLRSVELSKKWNLYRQNYCGCVYSFHEAELRNKESLTQKS